MLNTDRLPELYRKRALVQTELAELDKQIAETLAPDGGEGKAPPKRRRPDYVPPEKAASPVDMQRARRVLQRRGYAVREDS